MTAAGLAEFAFSCLGHPVITTAPSSHQVNNLLWRQIRINRMNAKIRLPGICQQTPNIKTASAKWFATGFTTDKPDRAQGPHIDNLLIIVDEAAGLADWFWTAIKGWMTNPGCRLLAIGNPNLERNKFWQAFHERLDDPRVNTIHISAHNSPSVTYWECGTPKTPEEQEPPIPGLADDAWLTARAQEWGKDSVEYQLKALGKFVVDTEEKALPLPWIYDARRRPGQVKEFGTVGPVQPANPASGNTIRKLALDVARAGKDKCALGGLRGSRHVEIYKYWDEPDSMATVDVVCQFLSTLTPRPECLIVDANAVGGPVYDELVRRRKKHPDIFGQCQVVPLDWGSTADEPDRFINVVSELYHRARRLISPECPELERLTLPSDAELARVCPGLTFKDLAAQLNARKCGYDEKLRFWIESKKLLRKRAKELGKATSPDLADMIAALLYISRQRRITFFSA